MSQQVMLQSTLLTDLNIILLTALGAVEVGIDATVKLAPFRTAQLVFAVMTAGHWGYCC